MREKFSVSIGDDTPCHHIMKSDNFLTSSNNDEQCEMHYHSCDIE